MVTYGNVAMKITYNYHKGEIMSKLIDKIKNEIVGEVMTNIELENYMNEKGYYLLEQDDKQDLHVVKFTNYKSQLWIGYDTDEDNLMLITKISTITRLTNEPTKVRPFQTYEDLLAVQNYFYNKGMYHYWLTGWLMVAFGRRVGDTISLKWSDIYDKYGEFKDRLNALKEEKTGKIVGARINDLAKYYIVDYCKIVDINPMDHYYEKIFSFTDAAFRKALKEAVNKLGFKYPISTHSYRKYYGNTLYKLHPQDADKLSIIQSMFGHSSPEITKDYIDEIDKKIDKYNEDFSVYMLNIKDGILPIIKNNPIIALKSDDFRNIMSLCWDLGNSGKDKFESINELIDKAEQLMV